MTFVVKDFSSLPSAPYKKNALAFMFDPDYTPSGPNDTSFRTIALEQIATRKFDWDMTGVVVPASLVNVTDISGQPLTPMVITGNNTATFPAGSGLGLVTLGDTPLSPTGKYWFVAAFSRPGYYASISFGASSYYGQKSLFVTANGLIVGNFGSTDPISPIQIIDPTFTEDQPALILLDVANKRISVKTTNVFVENISMGTNDMLWVEFLAYHFSGVVNVPTAMYLGSDLSQTPGWTLPVGYEDYAIVGGLGQAALPAGSKVGDVLKVTVAGSYNDVVFDVNDKAILLSTDTGEVVRFPDPVANAATVAKLSVKVPTDYATIGLAIGKLAKKVITTAGAYTILIEDSYVITDQDSTVFNSDYGWLTIRPENIASTIAMTASTFVQIAAGGTLGGFYGKYRYTGSVGSSTTLLTVAQGGRINTMYNFTGSDIIGLEAFDFPRVAFMTYWSDGCTPTIGYMRDIMTSSANDSYYSYGSLVYGFVPSTLGQFETNRMASFGGGVVANIIAPAAGSSVVNRFYNVGGGTGSNSCAAYLLVAGEISIGITAPQYAAMSTSTRLILASGYGTSPGNRGKISTIATGSGCLDADIFFGSNITVSNSANNLINAQDGQRIRLSGTLLANEWTPSHVIGFTGGQTDTSRLTFSVDQSIVPTPAFAVEPSNFFAMEIGSNVGMSSGMYTPRGSLWISSDHTDYDGISGENITGLGAFTDNAYIQNDSPLRTALTRLQSQLVDINNVQLPGLAVTKVETTLPITGYKARGEFYDFTDTAPSSVSLVEFTVGSLFYLRLGAVGYATDPFGKAIAGFNTAQDTVLIRVKDAGGGNYAYDITYLNDGHTKLSDTGVDFDTFIWGSYTYRTLANSNNTNAPSANLGGYLTVLGKIDGNIVPAAGEIVSTQRFVAMDGRIFQRQRIYNVWTKWTLVSTPWPIKVLTSPASPYDVTDADIGTVLKIEGVTGDSVVNVRFDPTASDKFVDCGAKFRVTSVHTAQIAITASTSTTSASTHLVQDDNAIVEVEYVGSNIKFTGDTATETTQSVAATNGGSLTVNPGVDTVILTGGTNITGGFTLTGHANWVPGKYFTVVSDADVDVITLSLGYTRIGIVSPLTLKAGIPLTFRTVFITGTGFRWIPV